MRRGEGRVRILAAISLLLAVAVSTSGQEAPSISPFGVLHGASHRSVVETDATFACALAGCGLAPGTFVIVRGAGLGPPEPLAAQAPYPLRLPDMDGGTEIRFRSWATGQVIQARMIYSGPFEAAAIVPDDLPLGLAELTVWYRGQTSEPYGVFIAESAPGLFARSRQGSGPAVALNYHSESEQTPNRLARPARPGQYIVLWGSGLGSARAEDVRIVAGGAALTPSYAGPAPGLPGVDQYNVRLPDDFAPRGCGVGVAVQVGDYSSNELKLAVSDAGESCAHPWGLSAEKLEELDAGGRMSWLSLYVYDSEPLPYRSLLEIFFPASPSRTIRGVAEAVNVLGLPLGENAATESLAPSGQCEDRFSLLGGQFFYPNLLVSGILFAFGPDSPSIPLDAGLAWTVTNPLGGELSLDGHGLSAPIVTTYPPRYGPVGLGGPATPGVWTWRVPGGEQVPPFEAEFRVPPAPRLTPIEEFRRGADATIEWAADGYAEGDVAEFEIVSWTEPLPNVVGRLHCATEARAGRLVVPFGRPGALANIATSVDVTMRVRARPLAPTIEGIDRVDISTTVERAWRIPVR